jgi:hypothetical protein
MRQWRIGVGLLAFAVHKKVLDFGMHSKVDNPYGAAN